MREELTRGRSPARQQSRAPRDFDNGGTEGLFARIVDAILANPVRSGAVLVVALTTSVIVANAVFFQSGRHPSPFFGAARPEVGKAPVVKTVVAPATGTSNTVARPAEKLPASRNTLPAADDQKLVADIQRALAAQGLYNGPVDGKWGARTKTALQAFQQRIGVQATGEPSQAMLASLTIGNGVASTDATGSVDPRQRLRAVQAALNQIGYGPVKVDGALGPPTADAIRRFELDNGMPITGNAGAELVKKLQTIGALGPL